MNISHQNWKPDTCECLVEEEYDRDDPQAVMTCSKVIKKCDVHQSVDDKNLYGVLYANPDGENKRKNLLHKKLIEDGTLGLSTQVKNKDGTSSFAFNEGVEYVWSFSGTGSSRVLNFDIKGAVFDSTQVSTIDAFCSNTFGAAKVVPTYATISVDPISLPPTSDPLTP